MTKKEAVFRRGTLSIDVDGGYLYQIDMERCTDAAQLLDFILQINNKSWATPAMMKQVLDCVEEACRHVHRTGAQGVFCPGGAYRRVKWPKRGSYHFPAL